jgi:hypothetical protein
MKLAECSTMTDVEIAAEIQKLGDQFDAVRADLEGMSGSPGEWMIERIGELETEQRRRADGTQLSLEL